ncbi:histidine kinase [Metabacillus halosaccharovorans]|nr:histidine kinase [Metabacillus halosaccharovorans]
MARDLHNSLAQGLTGLVMKLEAIDDLRFVSISE